MDKGHIIEVEGGYIRLVDYMGGDISPVNAARVSFGKAVEEIKPKDIRLIEFLTKHQHTAPFRHAYVTFEIKAPIFVSRQWYKHVIGAGYSDTAHKDHGWSEISGRYIAYDGYWTPNYFRVAPENKKQGSIDTPHYRTDYWIEEYERYINGAIDLYERMIADGVAAEQARAIVPLSMYTQWYWTASFQAIAHFVNLRDTDEAQKEIKSYATAIDHIMSELYPQTWPYRKGLA